MPSVAYELTAICDACGRRLTFQLDAFGKRFAERPLPRGWTHVHRGGKPGTITPEIGIACSRACLAKARSILLACPAQERVSSLRDVPSNGRGPRG